MTPTFGQVILAIVIGVWLAVFYLAWSFSRAAATSEQGSEYHTND